ELFSIKMRFNPIKLLNLGRYNLFSRFLGRITSFLMDLIGIGIPFDCTWKLLSKLHDNGTVFSGTFPSDPVGLKKPYQFCDYKIYSNALIYLCISSKDAIFETQVDFGTDLKKKTQLSIDKYMRGGFITQISSNKAKHAYFDLLKINALQYYESTKGTFYYNANQPVGVTDSEGNIALFATAANPNLNHLIMTAPDKIIEMSLNKEGESVQVFVAEQSQNSILKNKKNAMQELKKENITLILAFECANRAMLLADRYLELMDIYGKELGEIPFLGIISGGEIASQKIPVFNFSSVLFIIKEKK
ncbi:MAG: FIST C-terminal domain-containing protein, partial [Candidatus Hodarchaeales archaeon]